MPPGHGDVPDGASAPDPAAGGQTGSAPAETTGERLPGQAVPPPPDAGKSTGVGSGVEWRRLHRVTPLLDAWKVAAVLFAVALYQSSEGLAALREILPAIALLGILLGILLLGFLLGFGYGVLAWRRTAYGVSEDSVFLHKGVLFRQQRYVRLDRVQAIEVTQPLLARIFGFASLKIESAGGAGSNLTISYLQEPDAQQLRNELLARAAGIKVGAPGGAGAHQDVAGQGGTAQAGQSAPAQAGLAPAAPEREILALGVGRLVGSLALSVSIVIAALALVAVAVAAIVTRNPGSFAGMLAPLIGAAFYIWTRLAGEFAFRVAISPDGIRVRQGLLETKARTVPPGRVQAVRISQPLLWRFKGWWRIQVNIAGYGADEQTGTVLFPAATDEEVAYILSLVLPDLGDPQPLEVLGAGMIGFDADAGYVTSPRRARWIDWITWRRTGFRTTDTAILMRTGRLWRQLIVVPHERTQSLGLTQGPIERRMNLGTFVVHSTPGPVVPQVHHLDIQIAKQLLTEQTERARRARSSAAPERWMTTGQPGQPPEAPQEPEVPVTRQQFAGVLPSRATWAGNDGGVLPTVVRAAEPSE